MTRRRKSLIAAVGAAAVLVLVGLGARVSGPRGQGGDLCEGDLHELFEGCANLPSECGEVPEEYKDACENACETLYCPQQVAYLLRDPIWNLPCTDLHGPRFWRNWDDAEARCNNEFHFGHVEIDWAAWRECHRTDIEQHCPAFAGTDWYAKYRAARKSR
jgi:hypothetical protein